MARYTSGGVRFHVTDLTPIGGSLGDPIDIGGVTELNIPSGIETQADDAGLDFDQTRSVVNVSPVPTFTSKSLRQIFSIMGVGGFCYGGTPGAGNVEGPHPGLELYGRRLSDCQDPPVGSEDAVYGSRAGLLILGNLSADRGQDATLSVICHTLVGDVNVPLSTTFGSSMPTTLVEEQFTLGHSMVAGVGLNDALAGISLDFGVAISDKMPNPGTVSPQSVGVRKVQPSLTLRLLDPALEDVFDGLSGANLTHADTQFQLRKRADRGTMVGAGTAEHILLTMYGMLYAGTPFQGSGNADANAEYTLMGMDDGTNAPVVINHSTTYDTDLTS